MLSLTLADRTQQELLHHYLIILEEVALLRNSTKSNLKLSEFMNKL